jgi:hypothetical protein
MKINPALPLSEKKRIAGGMGGRKTVRRHGKRYMKRLGKWGGHRTHSLYRMEPVLLNDFALVHRQTGVVVALLSGRDPQDFTLPTFQPDPQYTELVF